MKNLLYILFLALTVVACQQEEEIDSTIVTPIINPPKVEVEGSFKGEVTNEYGDFVAEAEVEFNGKTVWTDENGHFEMLGIQLFEDGSYVQVSKSGYFLASRKFYANEGDVNNIRIQLIPKELISTVPSSIGGEIYVNDAAIQLPPGQYRTLDNQVYNGEVNVYAKWLDPSKV